MDNLNILGVDKPTKRTKEQINASKETFFKSPVNGNRLRAITEDCKWYKMQSCNFPLITFKPIILFSQLSQYKKSIINLLISSNKNAYI